MDEGCRLWGFEASTMTLQHHSDSAIPPISRKIKNPPPPSEAYQWKGAPTCPSTAYQGAKTHCIYMIWMWDAVYRGLECPPIEKTIIKNPPKCILASKMPASRGKLA